MVNEKTRERILEIARQLTYTVDKNASNLRTRLTHTLALLFFEDPTADESNINPFFLSMQSWITRTCSERGYDLLISFQQMSHNWHAEYAESRKADGLILLGYGDYTAYRGKLDTLLQSGTHFVRWGAVMADQPGVSCSAGIAICWPRAQPSGTAGIVAPGACATTGPLTACRCKRRRRTRTHCTTGIASSWPCAMPGR